MKLKLLILFLILAVVYSGTCARRLKRRESSSESSSSGSRSSSNSTDDSCFRQLNTSTVCGAAFNVLSKLNQLDDDDDDLARLDISLFNTSLDILCSDCLLLYEDYFTCRGERDRFNYLRETACAKETTNNEYCPTRLFQIERLNITVGNCNVTNTSTCNSDCTNYINQINNRLGCCASSLFRSVVSGGYRTRLTEGKYTACGLTLGTACDPATLPSRDGGMATTASIVLVLLTIALSVILRE